MAEPLAGAQRQGEVAGGNRIGTATGRRQFMNLESMSFGIGAGDAATYALGAAGLILIATLANLIPARRASAVDPARALRPQ